MINHAYSGPPWLQQKVSNTSTSGKTRFDNSISLKILMCIIYLLSSTPVTSSPSISNTICIIAISSITWWFPSKISHIPSQCSLSHYFCRENYFLLLYSFRNNHSNRIGTPIGSHPDRTNRSYLHLYCQGGVNGSRLNKYWLQHLSFLRSK